MRQRLVWGVLLCLVVGSQQVASGKETKPRKHPLSTQKRKAFQTTFKKTVAEMTERIKRDPKKIEWYSRRADAYFFLGKFKKAVADYEKMVALNPKLNSSHWRRGIAWFYAGEYRKAAHQFEIYNTFDNVDRENGIWRFFSQTKAHGLKKARQSLLKYKKDDREPFPDVYRLFSADITGKEILRKIAAAKIDKTEREKRLFYAELYIGLDHALHGRNQEAIQHLEKAVANQWGPTAGFGPNYMWHVGRLHYELLTKSNSK
ncbi:MAG: hypothetical protein Tsb009_24770 [Planctomycetaceae bacterium]